LSHKDGYVAGTLVHTGDGLRPIETIRVGDSVLSHSEDPSQDSGRDYKSVTRVHCFGDRNIMQFVWAHNDGSGNGSFDHALSTPNPPIWSHPQGWLPIARVPYTSAGTVEWLGRNLIMADGSVGERYELNRVYRTKNSDIAYVHCDGYGSGNYVDLSSAPHRFLSEHEESLVEPSREDQDSDEWFTLTATVYHLEVQDWHTFFIGKTGVLVHDARFTSANVPINLIGWE